MELEQLQSLLAGTIHPTQSDGSLVSVRAGICTQQGDTVTSDSRTGTLVLLERDGLLHVQWKLRPSNDTQQDYIIMPNEATIELIPECTDGRVLLIDFPEDLSRRHFYWLQEPQKNNDAQIVEKIQGYFSGRTSLSGRSVQDSAVSSRNNLNQNELLALLTGASQQGNQAETRESLQVFSLSAVLDPEHLIPVLLAEPDILENVVEFLPEEQQSQEQVFAQLRSPQLHQTLERLSMAINSGQGQSLLHQFNIRCDDGFGVFEMLNAIMRQFRN